MAGFVRVEEKSEKQLKGSLLALSPCSVAATPEGRSDRKVSSRWLYGVLRGDTLQLYWRRSDYKRKIPPLDTFTLQMQPAAPNESVFSFDHECLYVREKESGHVLALRVHQRKDIVRWVTALYYRSIASEQLGHKHKHHTHSLGKYDKSGADDPEPQLCRRSVSFEEKPLVWVLPQETYDPADLFYSEDDYRRFLMDRPSHLSSFMSTIYAKTTAKLRTSRKR